jgi:transmembrane sensor
MNQQEFYRQLVHRHVSNEATEEELETFFHLLETGEINDTLEAYLNEEAGTMAAEETEQPLRRSRLWRRLAVAASVLLCCTIGLYIYEHNHQKTASPIAQNDIAPGNKKPVLTLANGQRIVLYNTQTGKIAQQGAVAINQTAAGQLVYSKAGTMTDAPYNTLTNPRGSKVISLTLPDGTMAKIDAGSSITYRTAFTGKTREVSITGRVYFSVKYDQQQPFSVISNGQTVTDLGTQFIVEAFNDEPAMKTTLLEGKAQVSKAGQNVMLKPGQQTIIQANNNIIKIKAADIDEESAWMNGDFQFAGEDLQTTLRDVSRFYDITIVYQGAPKDLRLAGQVSRSKNLSAVLSAMELTGKVHFKIEGRSVTVTP